MSIKINVNNSEISGYAHVLDGVIISDNDDINITLQDTKICEYAKVLSDLEINSVLDQLRQEVQKMNKSSKEYSSICEILKMKKLTREGFIKCIIKHLGTFSEGVLASIIANSLT